MAASTKETDDVCQELHGIFQFTDELFAEQARAKEYTLPSYAPIILHPQWFLDHPSNDLTALKYQLDWLFYGKQYGEACQRARHALDFLQARAAGTRRELFETILECALKASDHELAQRMYTHLMGIKVEDSALEYVLDKASSYLEGLGISPDDGNQ